MEVRNDVLIRLLKRPPMNCRLPVVLFLVRPISGSSWEVKVGGVCSGCFPHVIPMSSMPRDRT